MIQSGTEHPEWHIKVTGHNERRRINSSMWLQQMRSLNIVRRSLYLLLHLLYLIHRQGRHCFNLSASVTIWLSLLLLLTIGHPLQVFLFDLFQSSLHITRDILATLATTLILIVLIFGHRHGHDGVIFAARRRLRNCTVIKR